MIRNTHSFSPIVTNERYNTALEYVAAETLLLARKVLDREVSIDTICFFSHTPEEYAFLEGEVRSRGEISRFSHDPTLYVDTDFMVVGQHIKIFGVRKPDPTRPWVGYGDYPLSDSDYDALCSTANPFVRRITSGIGQSLLQFEHPDFDVLGYAVRMRDHE